MAWMKKETMSMAISIEGNNGIGILKATMDAQSKLSVDKGRQNKLLATDQEGFTYKLYLK
jgi:hypothetical protein